MSTDIVKDKKPANIDEMRYFIGTKLIQARSMNLGDYNKFRGWDIPEDEDPARAGYLLRYPDGYNSWSPRDVFDNAYLLLDGEKNSISQEMINVFIKSTQAVTIGNKTTLVQVELVNGFMVTETSSCVDPENYDIELGKQVCIRKINEKIWELLGFLLQTAIGGVK